MVSERLRRTKARHAWRPWRSVSWRRSPSAGFPCSTCCGSGAGGAPAAPPPARGDGGIAAAEAGPDFAARLTERRLEAVEAAQAELGQRLASLDAEGPARMQEIAGSLVGPDPRQEREHRDHARRARGLARQAGDARADRRPRRGARALRAARHPARRARGGGRAREGHHRGAARRAAGGAVRRLRRDPRPPGVAEGHDAGDGPHPPRALGGAAGRARGIARAARPARGAGPLRGAAGGDCGRPCTSRIEDLEAPARTRSRRSPSS